MDRGAWWATVHGATENRIQLKQLSTAWRVLLSPCIECKELDLHFILLSGKKFSSSYQLKLFMEALH